MITAYDILNAEIHPNELTLNNYDQWVEGFQCSFWKDHNFQENLFKHRKPQEYKQQVLQDLYNLNTLIQQRPELRDFNPTKNAHGYVHIRVQEIWEADKQLKSIYNATKRYCEISGKDFPTCLAHIAEYRALNLLIKKLKRSIYNIPNIKPRALVKERTVAKKRKSVSAKLRRQLQKEVNSQCPFCGNQEVAIHEIHHIDQDPGNNTLENLIHLCANCHNQITIGSISRGAGNGPSNYRYNKLLIHHYNFFMALLIAL